MLKLSITISCLFLIIVWGCCPAKVYTLLENQLLKKQDLNRINTVSSTTYSYYRFRYTVIIALIKARMAAEI